MSVIKRGDLYWLDWSPGRGSEQTGVRPTLVVQGNSGNENPVYKNTVVVAVSTKGRQTRTQIALTPSPLNGLTQNSFVKCQQLLTVSKDRLATFIGRLSEDEMSAVDEGLHDVLDLQ